LVRTLLLVVAAYLLVAVESAVQHAGPGNPYGCFVWLLLPWLAVFPSGRGAILLAGGCGFVLDCLSGHHPGLILAATVLATLGLQRLLLPAWLATASRVFLVSFGTCCLMALLTAGLIGITEGNPASPRDIAVSIAVSSAIAAGFATAAVSVFRSTFGLVMNDDANPMLS